MVKGSKINVELYNQNLALLIRKIPKKLRSRVVGKALSAYLSRLGPDVIDLLTDDRELFYLANLEAVGNDIDMAFDLDIPKLDSIASAVEGKEPDKSDDDNSDFNGVFDG